MDEWKCIIIDGEDTNYSISSAGAIKNNTTGEILKCSIVNGYYMHKIYHNGKVYQKKIHRLVAQAFIPNPEGFPVVNHINCIKTDNCVENLEWCTQKYNTQHAHDNGLCDHLIGDNSPNHKFTEKQIREVCKLFEDGEYEFDEIELKTGVDKRALTRILREDSWKNITKNYDFSKIRSKSNHQKCKQYPDIYKSVDRAIISGKTRNEIIKALKDYGLGHESARGLYDYRRKKVKNNKSPVQAMAYINDGDEIF